MGNVRAVPNPIQAMWRMPTPMQVRWLNANLNFRAVLAATKGAESSSRVSSTSGGVTVTTADADEVTAATAAA